MSFHFQQLKNMKNLLTLAEPRFLLRILLVVVTYFTTGRETRYPLYRRLGGPHGRSGQGQKISPPPGFDPWTVQPVASCYSDYAILTHYCVHLNFFKLFQVFHNKKCHFICSESILNCLYNFLQGTLFLNICRYSEDFVLDVKCFIIVCCNSPREVTLQHYGV
jgi:hypothetical protein